MNLTKKQSGFVRDYIQTGNATLATKKNCAVTDDSNTAIIGSQNLRKSKK